MTVADHPPAAERRPAVPPPPARIADMPAAHRDVPAVGAAPVPTRPGPRHAAAADPWIAPPRGKVLAVVFAVAWLTCPLVEPLPTGDVHYPLWQLPVDIGTVVSIVLAVAALWRGSRHSARLGLVAGGFMAVMTMVCPLAGHTPVGWWTWVQTGMSLFVLLTSAALPRLVPGLGRPVS
ncbi:hypothetical protein [Blastococcus montanus]|uniref:hypothetical protein n=1 Tax=Blastococcus montanus TaxID=3144973 RepID=UPI003207B7A4